MVACIRRGYHRCCETVQFSGVAIFCSSDFNDENADLKHFPTLFSDGERLTKHDMHGRKYGLCESMILRSNAKMNRFRQTCARFFRVWISVDAKMAVESEKTGKDV